MMFANLFGMGGPDIWIVAGVVVLLFGGSKLPTFMRSLGDGMKEFKKATKEMNTDPEAEVHAPQPVVVEQTRTIEPAPKLIEPAATAPSSKE